MFNRKTTFFYSLLIAITSLVVGMVIASRLGLAPESGAQPIATPSINSAPIDGPLDSRTFRNIAQAASPAVVNIRTESRRRNQNLSEYFGGDDLLSVSLEIHKGDVKNQENSFRKLLALALLLINLV